jgi:hypothetical protein
MGETCNTHGEKNVTRVPRDELSNKLLLFELKYFSHIVVWDGLVNKQYIKGVNMMWADT